VAALQQIAPAAALGTSAIISLQLAANTFKLAMIGVEDAVKVAFDPGAKGKELQEALEKLSPSARAFVLELRDMRGQFKEIQQTVQENFFQGFDKALQNLSKSAIPVLGNGLKTTARTLNEMALGAANAADKLAKDGVLGRAISGANIGLDNLKKIPGQALTAFTQLGAAAAPAFDRVTASVETLASRVSEQLTQAFEDGRLEGAIDRAVDAIAQLGRIFGNVFKGVGNIIKGFTVQGEGLFGTLEKITKAFADVTATKGFQDALRALSQTVSVIVSTALPILSTALQALGPIFQALAPPIQSLVKTLGPVLTKVIEALGPVLVVAAQAIGTFIEAINPLITLAGTLISAILPVLNPLFKALSDIFVAMTPFIKQLADNIAAQPLPIFTVLATEVLPQLLAPLVKLAQEIFPVLTEVMAAIGPQLGELAIAFGQLLVALVPLIAGLLELIIKIGQELKPLLGPLTKGFIALVTDGIQFLTGFITRIVIPLLNALVTFLRGDTAGALKIVKEVARDVGESVAQYVRDMKDNVVEAAREMGESVIRYFAGLGQSLYNAGRDFVQGFINGIRDMAGSVIAQARSIAEDVVSVVKGVLDIGSPSKVMAGVGEDTMQGFINGLADKVPELASTMQDIAGMAPSFALPNGQSLRLPQYSAQAPTVQVYLGNQLIDNHIDTRITVSNLARDRVAMQGVRR
jgi:hypothetical protein